MPGAGELMKSFDTKCHTPVRPEQHVALLTHGVSAEVAVSVEIRDEVMSTGDPNAGRAADRDRLDLGLRFQTLGDDRWAGPVRLKNVEEGDVGLTPAKQFYALAAASP